MRLGESAYVVGIVLTVTTHSGPQFVYHYQSEVPIEYKSNFEADLFDSDQSSDLDWSDEDAEAPSVPVTLNVPMPIDLTSRETRTVNVNYKSRQEQSDDPTQKNSRQTPGKERLIFGLEQSYLAEILAPPRQLSNQRFELGVDDHIFLGIPVHILPTGTWRRLKNAPAEPSLNGEKPEHQHEEDIDDVTENLEETKLEDGAGDDEEADPKDPKVVGETDSPLQMFHVAVVVNPPITEQAYVTDQMYRYIVTQLAKILRNEQASRNYVWNEVHKMNLIRDDVLSKDENASDESLNRALENGSELARALRELCRAVSVLGIARVHINNKVRAFQIPVDAEITRMPTRLQSDTDQYYRFHPTTSTIAGKEIVESDFDSFGLLLLDDPERILQQIEVDSTGPIPAVIRNIQPTMSIDALAKQNQISLKQMINLVYSLVYWRCARIIIPLFHRNYYVFSPLAPMSEISRLSSDFYRRFPMLPPMQRLLSALSTGKPQPFIYHIPSRDHHDVYMQALAWLIRHNLVVQLQTYATILVTRKIKLTVQQEVEDEEIAKNGNGKEARRADSSTDNTAKRGGSYSNIAKPHSMLDNIEEIRESYIQEPTRASLIEKKWINKIAASHTPEQAALFYRLLKYFNGRDCLEQVLLHENLPATELKRFLTDFHENITIYRHW